VRSVLAGVLALVGACTYSPNFGDCRVASCESAGDCPSGFTCDPDHFCRAPNQTTPCDQVLVDAMQSETDGSTIDGRANTCSGTPMTCGGYTALQTCNTQSGCTWVAPTCTVTTNCSQYTTNQACTSHPECFTDFANFSMCAKDTTYCVGATESACEARSVCQYAGGCGGTADACSAFTSSSACGAQMGCTWN
jgi:hypothetical protein